ncbi:MAG: hypothetical protein P8N46_01725 [Flavobacteriales bacterium]|nr:hypothetical protein [Flavobacteriales bacterium]
MAISRLISILLHPIFIPVISFYLSIRMVPSLDFTIANYQDYILLILIICTIILPALCMLFLIKFDVISSLEMRKNQERPIPLLLTGGFLILSLKLTEKLLIFTPVLKKELVGAIIIILLASIISKFWKISLHMLGVGGLIGVLVSLQYLYGGLSSMIIYFMLIAGITAMARIYLKAHNHSQIYIGFIVGFIIECVIILLF